MPGAHFNKCPGGWARLELTKPLLTKNELKMAGYWPSSYLRFYRTRWGQYKDNIFLGTNARNPEPAWLPNQNAGIVSSCTFGTKTRLSRDFSCNISKMSAMVSSGAPNT